jgi:hypothetical protein
MAWTWGAPARTSTGGRRPVHREAHPIRTLPELIAALICAGDRRTDPRLSRTQEDL